MTMYMEYTFIIIVTRVRKWLLIEGSGLQQRLYNWRADKSKSFMSVV